jgi:hypothetical protein
MSHRRLSRNVPCPCGSGKKYKHCCSGKGYEWIEDDQGAVARSIPLSAQAREIIERKRQRSLEHHGRQPRDDELLFFDAPPGEQMEHHMVQAMRKAGIDPAIIYAYEMTGGLLVTQDNLHLISDRDLAAWQEAIEEYRARKPPIEE